MQVEGVGAQLARTIVYRLNEPYELSIILDKPLGHLAPPNLVLTPDVLMKGSRTHTRWGCRKQEPKNALTIHLELSASPLQTVRLCNPLVENAFHGRESTKTLKNAKNVA